MAAAPEFIIGSFLSLKLELKALVLLFLKLFYSELKLDGFFESLPVGGETERPVRL